MNYASKNSKKRKRLEDGEGSEVEALDKADDQVGLAFMPKLSGAELCYRRCSMF